MPFAENLGTGGGVLDARYGSVPTANTNAPRLLEPVPAPGVYLPGSVGNYVAVPDAPALDITGDLDVRVYLAMDDWTPAALQILASKWTITGNQRSWYFGVSTNGTLRLATSNDGSASLIHDGATAVPIADGGAIWVRATMDVDNGAGSRVVIFWTSPDGVAWTQLGATNTYAGATSIYASTATVDVSGATSGGSNPVAARVFRVQVRNGIGGPVVLDLPFSSMVTTGSEIAMSSSGPGSPVIPEPGQTLPNLGWGASALDARYGSAVGSDTNDPLTLSHVGTNYVYLPGVNNNLMAVSDCPALRVTGDLEIVCRLALDDWTPTGGAFPAGKRQTGGNQRSYLFEVTSAGTLRFYWSANGSTETLITSTVATSFVDGATGWIKVTFDVDNGAAGNDVKFWTAPDSVTEPTVWTQLGTTITTAGVASIFSGSANVTVGAWVDGGATAGKMYRAIIRNGIGGTTVLDLDCTTALVDGAQTSLAISGTAADQIDNALVLTNLGTGGPVLNAQRGSVLTNSDSNEPAVLDHAGTNFLWLPGLNNNFASTPDAPALDITGDIDIRARVSFDNYTGVQLIVGKSSGATTGGYEFGVSSGQPIFRWSNAGGYTSRLTISTLASVGISVGQTVWLRGQLDADNGAGGAQVSFFWAPDSDTEPTSWTAFTQPAPEAATTSIGNSSTALALGAYHNGGASPMSGRIFRTIIRPDLTSGAAAFDANFTTGITSGDQTTFTESSANAATVTINRSTTGRKSVAVVQPTLLFGTDDYLSLDDNDLIDITASDSATVMVASRIWGTPTAAARFFHKGGITGPRWGLSVPATGALNRVQGFLSDGVAATVSADSGTFTAGSIFTAAATFSRATQQITPFVGATAGTPSSSIAGLNAANTATGRVGSNAGTNYIDMEMFGAAIWRRVLTTAELQTVSDHYAGTVTVASVALLSEAAVWIDPARSAQAVAIGRSTSGRKTVGVTRPVLLFGTDDYLEIPDSDLLDFGATDSFSLVAAVRQWGTFTTTGVMIAKSSASGNTSIGWRMRNGLGTPAEARFEFADGAIGESVANGTNTVAGRLTVQAGIRNVAADNVQMFTDDIAGVAVADDTTSTLANSDVVRIGRYSGIGTSYLDMEFFGAAVFRRALTAGEIATVTAHYRTGPTAASRALLSEAVLWLDAGTRQVATINRSATGRKSVAVAEPVWLLGADDFFEVPDTDDLLDMGIAQDFSALVIERPWNAQGSSDTLVAKVDSTTVTAQGWAVSNPTTGDPTRTAGRIGTGTTGVEAFGPSQVIGRKQAVLVVRSGSTLTAYTGSTAGTPVASPTGDLSNAGVMRIGRLAGAGTEYLDGEILAVAVWRRVLTPAEITAILNYYGAA